MKLLIGTDPYTGSEMYRELDNFNGGIIDPMIIVVYRQWLLTPNGVKYNEENNKKYYVMDIPAITRKGDPILVTPEVLDVDGVTIITPAVYDTNVPDIVITPAELHYTGWRQKIISQQMVGAKLGDDIIIGSINATLQSLPFDVIDGYIIRA